MELLLLYNVRVKTGIKVITELKAELETRNDDFNKLEDQVERLGKMPQLYQKL